MLYHFGGVKVAGVPHCKKNIGRNKRERHTHTETERQRETETERETDRQTER